MLLNNYDTATHQGIARAAKHLGWHLNASVRTAFRLQENWKGDGIICALGDAENLVQFVVNAQVPTVDLSLWRTELDLPRIAADNVRIGQLAAEHLCAFGHTNFAWFSNQQNPTADLRLKGFRTELSKQEKTLPAQLMGKKAKNPQAVLKWLQTLKRPCAIFAFNDLNTAWLLSICIDSGFSVPQDFAILGVDNDLLTCEHQPISLSSINHDHERVGFEGAHLLDDIMSGKLPGEQIQLIKPNGVTLRDSTDLFAVSDPLVQAAIEYMLQHLREPIGTPEISEALGISRRNLEMRFQTALQSGIHKKLVEMRLKKVVQMLCNTDRKIEDIAALTGFCHAPHLCHAFKNKYGLPPSTYRKNNRSE